LPLRYLRFDFDYVVADYASALFFFFLF